jgi:hypothetical protein
MATILPVLPRRNANMAHFAVEVAEENIAFGVYCECGYSFHETKEEPIDVCEYSKCRLFPSWETLQ